MTRRPNAYTQSLQEAQKRAEQGEGTTAKQDNGKTLKPQNIETVELQSGKIAELQNSITAKEQEESQEEKATEKLTLYLHPTQRDKLDELIMEYKKQTGKRITHNKLMRILIEKAEIERLL